MPGIKTPPIVKKLALSVAGGPYLRKLHTASKNVQQAQLKVLQSMLGACKDTAFGRDHGLGTVKTPQDFANAVPVRDFEAHRPYIDRMQKGEANVLFSGKPLFYNMTSGTTDKPKLIPVSKEYYERAYDGISKLWFYTCLKDNPRLFNGQNLSAVAPAVEGHVEDGTPYGSISGVVYKNIPGFMKDLYSTPYPVICIPDYQKKYYAMLRFGLASNITYIITVNPSTLLQFHATVMSQAHDLIRDINDGTLREDVMREIEPQYRDEIRGALKADRKRAAFLDKVVTMHGDNLRPKHYWPDLVCINTWKQGNCSLILPKLHGFFPDSAVIREFGYQASEARAGIVLGNEWEYSVLLAHIYYFEFIEESQRGSPGARILGAHELEQGKNYYILITNGSGLYRYDINDIIQVRGFFGRFPLFTFLQKGEGVTSLTGEKISEQHVIKAVDEACMARRIKVEFYTMFCDPNDFGYKLFVEFGRDTTHAVKQSFINAVDEHLKYINPEYSVKRGTNRLKAPDLVELAPESYERLKQILLAKGVAREGQYKISCLRNDPGMLQIFKDLSIT